MNVIICDDKLEEAKDLRDLIEKSNFNVTTYIFDKASDVIKFISTDIIIDICFFDIIMPKMNGISLSAELRKMGYNGEITFVSSSKDFGPESYRVNAFSYLEKPATIDDINVLFSRLKNKNNFNDKSSITIRYASITERVFFINLIYVEVIKHNIYFHMHGGNTKCTHSSLSKIGSQILSDPRFIKCHRSYIVNMQFVVEITKDEITLLSGKKIPISRSFSDARKKFYKWKFEVSGDEN